MIANHRVSHRLSWWACPLLLFALAVLPGVPLRSAAADPQVDQYPRAVQQSLRVESTAGRLLSRLFARVAPTDDDDADPKAAGAKEDDDDKEAGGKDSDDTKPGDKDDDDGKHEQGKEDEDGEGRDQALTMSELPKAVRRTLRREARGGEIEDLERETENGRVIYSADVEYETEHGELVYEVEIAENGTLLHKVLEQGDDDEDGDAKADDKEDPDAKDKEGSARDKD